MPHIKSLLSEEIFKVNWKEKPFFLVYQFCISTYPFTKYLKCSRLPLQSLKILKLSPHLLLQPEGLSCKIWYLYCFFSKDFRYHRDKLESPGPIAKLQGEMDIVFFFTTCLNRGRSRKCHFFLGCPKVRSSHCHYCFESA